MAGYQGSSAAEQQQQRDGDFEPVYEWLDAGANYLLRLNVPEFKKEDFHVTVDSSGRLTIRGQHGSLMFHKVFQLPPTSNLDGITGKLEGSVLVITVPKLPPKAKADEEKADTKKAGEDVAGKPTERLAAGKHGQENKEEPKAAAPAAPPPRSEPEPAARERKDDDEKARAEHKARLSPEADRRIEAARARLAARAPRPAPAPEKKTPCWKERAAEGGLKLAEAIGKNKEVVATAIAAFTLGVFISSKLFSRNN
ncbi:hypothetical protein E2562_005962 [Oryza meyeriana var. granulata]|uniref:SHSP domain-containing protein n=1 Tax=Oryza meyeriana var. granulata TaxID=110450 RepID=A0A6G1DV76_9ORYZ|nr:hypothetical protein E2562_005962 [Oryza meyeriana var. granulata]